MKNLKAITPVISIIILLLIAVALAGAAYTFLGGYLGAYTEKSFTIPPNGAFCDAKKRIHVIITNTGTTTLKKEDFTTFQVENTQGVMSEMKDSLKDTEGNGNFEIKPGESASILNYDRDNLGWGCGTGSCYSGRHKIIVGTSGSVVTAYAICP